MIRSPHDARDLGVRISRHLTGDHHQTGRDQRLDRHPTVRIVGKEVVQDRVADLVGDLVRVTLGHGFGSEQPVRHSRCLRVRSGGLAVRRSGTLLSPTGFSALRSRSGGANSSLSRPPRSTAGSGCMRGRDHRDLAGRAAEHLVRDPPRSAPAGRNPCGPAWPGRARAGLSSAGVSAAKPTSTCRGSLRRATSDARTSVVCTSSSRSPSSPDFFSLVVAGRGRRVVGRSRRHHDDVGVLGSGVVMAEARSAVEVTGTRSRSAGAGSPTLAATSGPPPHATRRPGPAPSPSARTRSCRGIAPGRGARGCRRR